MPADSIPGKETQATVLGWWVEPTQTWKIYVDDLTLTAAKQTS